MLDILEQNYTDYQDIEVYLPAAREGIELKRYYFFGGLIGLAVMAVIYAIYPETHHWSFLIITLCCTVLSAVVFSWITGKRDTFDPLATSCLLLLQLLVITPLIHLVTREYGMAIEGDDRALLGRTIAMCLIGLIPFFLGYMLKIGEKLSIKIFGRPAEISLPRLRTALTFMFIISVTAWLYYYIRFRGAITWETRQSASAGLGVLMMLTDMVCAAALLWATYKVILKREQTGLDLGAKERVGLFGSFFIAMLVVLVSLGYRGSRALVLIHMMWAGGIYHFAVKRIRAVTILLIFICLLPVLHFYTLYKSYGMAGFRAIFNPAERASMEETASRSFIGTITGDMGRMPVWMFMKQEIDAGRYPLQWGRTYLMAFVTLVPRRIWPSRPYGINEVITDMETGKGTFASLYQKTTRIAGLPGEAYANLGFMGVMLMFFVWGVVIRMVKTITDRWRSDPLLAFLLPPIIFFAVTFVMGNSDVFVQNFVRFMAPSVLAVWYSRMKIYDDGYYQQTSGS